MVRILFTKSDLIGSNTIRWGLEEPVSHVAIQFGNYVAHSTWGGVDIDHLTTFTKHRQIVFAVDIKGDENKISELLSKYESKSYDFTGLIYFILMAVRRKLFGIALPKTNKWAKDNTFLCTELATKLVEGKENGIITPYELYLTLKEKN